MIYSLFRILKLAVPSPFFYGLRHVVGEFAAKQHFLLCGGMDESQLLGMQRLSWTKAEAVVYKLLVFGVHGSFYNAVSAIKIVVKQRMANVLHVHPDLVCAAGFQPAFYQGYIVELLQYFVVGDGILAMVPIRVGGE